MNETVYILPDLVLKGGIKLVSASRWVELKDWPEGLLGLEIAKGVYVVPEHILEDIRRAG